MIEPKYFTLDSLFAKRVFRIPYYQRFYSWQKKQREDLFNDLENLYKKDEDRKDKDGDRHHFMATIVCLDTGEQKLVKSTEYKVYEIVDGQQRITTLVLLLKALQQRLEDEEEKKVISRVLVKDDDNLLLLQTNNINQRLFNRYIHDGVAPSQEEIETHADENLSEAIREIDTFLDKWKQERDVMELLSLIRNRIGFVVYDTEEKHAVYTIFECLNSRGLEVDWLDKAKSMLMGVAFEKSKSDSAAKAKIKELQDSWGKIYDAIAQYSVTGQEILRVTATLYCGSGAGKPLSAEDSLDEFRKFCDTAQKTITITEWLQKVTKKLVKLHERLFWKPVIRILQVRVLAVAIMLTDLLQDYERDTALEQWERVSFRIYGLCDKDSRSKVGDYVRLATQLIQKFEGTSNYKEIMTKLKLLGSDFPVKEAVDEWLKNPKYKGYEEECRYILWRYEEYLANEQNSEVNKELREKIWEARAASETIEHIFPQNPETGGPWEGKLEESASLENHIDRLGNLLLLPQRLNSEAGRQSFAQKKEIYKRTEGLRMVKEVLKQSDWTQDAIAQREDKISAFLLETFADVS